MTIEKGRDWGTVFDAERDRPVVEADSDVEVAMAAHHGFRQGKRPVIRVRSGDLLRTLGLDAPRHHGSLVFEVDLVLVETEAEEPIPLVAHVLIPPGRRRPAVMGMNTPWWRALRLAPRAHPNDGLIDVVSGRVPVGELAEAARRARSGSHLPHPGLTVERRSTWSMAFDRPAPLWVDGRFRGRRRRVTLTVVPDAFRLLA